MKTRDYIRLTVNGQSHQIRGPQAFLPLSSLLRYELGLTGTKIVCAEGDCGACTVMIQSPFDKSEKFHSINSCISTTFLMDLNQIISVDGLEKNNHLTDVQENMIKHFGGQCGFCTPGFVMSITNLYENATTITEQKVKNYLTGNLCRCTGYQPIIHAALAVDRKKVVPLKNYFECKNLSQGQDNESLIPIKITDGNREFFGPTSLLMAAEYKKNNPTVRIFSGATDLGVQINKGKNPGSAMMSLHLIPELYQISKVGEQIVVGARVNLHTVQKFMEAENSEFSEFLNIFASPQIKNAATLVGNLANGSPIADTTPFLLTAEATVELWGSSGSRHVPLVDFIKGYKSFDLNQDEFIIRILFKPPQAKKCKSALYKVSQRRDLDISCVNSSFVFQIKDRHIEKARIAYGGVGPKALRLFAVEKLLEGQDLNPQLIDQAKKMIYQGVAPISDLRGSAEFRSNICVDLFDRFVQENLT